jgi:hypothetical protein
MADATSVPRTLLEAPLPELIQRLGLAVAQAQSALDKNSIEVALALVDSKVQLGENEFSLLELGFTPTFYAFTEATLEAKLTFSVQEQEEFSIGGSLSVSYMSIVSATINASYTRKFSFQAEGASSIAARLVSLPAPSGFIERLNALRSGSTPAPAPGPSPSPAPAPS